MAFFQSAIGWMLDWKHVVVVVVVRFQGRSSNSNNSLNSRLLCPVFLSIAAK